MPRREIDPFLAKLVVAACVFVVCTVAFAAFVIHSERASYARAAATEAREQAQAEAEAQALAARYLDPNATLDAGARTALTAVVGRALDAYVHRASFAVAGASALSRSALAGGTMVFTDGPSTSATDVSVSAIADSWAAAVEAPSGTCYWIRATPQGATYYGTGRAGNACTGTAAQNAYGPSW